MNMKRKICFAALLCVLLGFSTSAFAGYAKGTIVVKSAPTDKEWGYVSVDKDKYIDATSREQSAESTSSWKAGGSTDISFYVSALALTGYYCAGWGTSSANTDVTTASIHKITKNCSVPLAWATNTTDFGTYYAIFKPVEITSPANGSTIQGATLAEPFGKAENAQITLSAKATCAEDFTVRITGNDYIQYNSHSFDNGNIVINYTYSAHNVDGTDEATVSVVSAGGENVYSFTLVCSTKLTPEFTLSPSPLSFGETSIVGSKTETIAPATSNTTAKNAVWTMWITGAQKDYFSVSGTGADGYAHPANGQASVIFSPSAEGSYSAQLKAFCVYTDGEGKSLQSATTIVELSGQGVAPKEALLTLSNTSANVGVYDETACLYTYLDQYGTIAHTADFIIGWANVDNLQYDFGSTNTAGVFTYTAENEENGKVRLTITAKSLQALAEATTYTATLTISAQSTIATDNSKTLTQTLKVSVTIHPKKKNTLAWGLPLYPKNTFYVLYTDDKDVPALSNINNTDTPITISCTTNGYNKYFSIDNTHYTLSPVAEYNANMSIKAVQPESDEYEEATLTGNLRVRKHDFAWVYTGGSGLYLYKNTYYPHFISSAAEQAGEATLKVSYYDDGVRTTAPVVKDGSFRQMLKQNADGTWAIQTGDTVTPRYYVNAQGNRVGQHLRLYIEQPATENYYASNQSPTFYIVKDPIHVPVSPNYSVNTTTGVKSGLWGNNHYQQNGSTFLVDKYNAEWIGYDWDWNTNTWTGKNTGRTDWTTVAKQGSTNAFVLQNNGYVVFHFRGVPQYTGFNMWFQTATLDGMVSIEESADGTTWTTIALPASAKSDYLATAGWKNGWMKGSSRYIRFSYKGNNHVVLSINIYEDNFVRTDFAPLSTVKMLDDTLTYHELNNADNGGWGTFDFTINAANWGKTGVEIECSNPHFSVVLDKPFDVAKGLDNYEEHTAHVKYDGAALYDETIVRIKLHNFYGSTATDSLRSYSFKVRAIGTGATMPQTITNATKSTKYITGTIGPNRNTAGSYDYMTNYAYSVGNIDPRIGLQEYDFVNCFGTDGLPLFDELYIFGVTTNDDDTYEKYNAYYPNEDNEWVLISNYYPKVTAVSNGNANSNAVTPCYVYKKDGNQYTLSETIDNIAGENKQIGVDVAANGQKIYFAGWCPMGSCGYTASDNGFFHIKGGSNAKVDIYLDNCTILGRSKMTGGKKTADYYYEPSFSTTMYCSGGSGAVFALETTSTNSNQPFQPTIHISGRCGLRSTGGNTVHIKVSILGINYENTASQHSAPIQMQISKNNQYEVLTIDDKWPTTYASTSTERTNGILALRKPIENAPSIDLGNGNSKLYIQGGQISLANSIPAGGDYQSSLAITYRLYQVSKLGITATLYGVGNDQSEGEVYFEDGTISCLPVNEKYAAYYHDLNCIKCPEKTYIKGGSYNCNVYACSDVTTTGESATDGVSSLCPLRLPITGTIKNDIATFVFPTETQKVNGQTLSEYYAEHGTYNRESVAAKNDSVCLMLPCDFFGLTPGTSTTTHAWAMCVPKFEVGSTINTNLGGSVMVKSDVANTTQHLLWAKIDNNIVNALGNYKSPELDMTMKISEGNYSEIDNETEYTIETELHSMFPVVADEWVSICPPFDVKKVYVLQAYPEELLQSESRGNVLDIQAKANLDLAYFLAYPVLGQDPPSTQAFSGLYQRWLSYEYGLDTTNNVYPKTANQKTVNGVKIDYYPPYYSSAKGYTKDYRGMQRITNFRGNNYDANFYLYHSKNKTWTYDGKKFTTDWELVVPQADSILLHAGEIYAMQFPYCPGCDDPENRDYWDYWTGKLIIMEGDGPQTIKGSNAQVEQFTTYDVENSAALRGNATFAKMQVPNYTGATEYLSNAFFHTSGTSRFTPSADQETGNIEPTNVFLLANPDTRTFSSASKRIVTSISVETGDVSYEDVTEDSSGVPTIGGDHTLFVTRTDNGICIAVRTPQRVRVYSSDGALVFDGHIDTTMDMAIVSAGIYMVRGEKEVLKVLVR